MGSNNGTGQPYWFKCAKCRLSRRKSGGCMNLEATGRTKPLAKAQQGRGGRRVLLYRVEYRCLDCNHVGWTRHCDARQLLVYAGVTPP